MLNGGSVSQSGKEECLESGLSWWEVAKNYGLNESTIRGWCKQRETLKEMKEKGFAFITW